LFILIFFFPCAANADDSGLLWLVNRKNSLPANFRPSDLVNFQGTELRAPARDAFSEMKTAMEADGIRGLKLQSAYRAYSYQRAVFNERVRMIETKGINRSAAEAIAARSIQAEGASEHQLGLALDVSIDGKLSQSFAETDAGRWIAENCHKFGFIIRYPEAKTYVTKIIYEPWHLRYVGIPHAQIMYETTLTLEEYHVFLAKIPMYIVWEEDFYFLVMYKNSPPENADAEIFGISATKQGENAGYIVTLKKPALQR
jgi:D-alanyl-D-alanine carboxypeptidase